MSQDYLDKLIEKDKAGTQIQSIPLHDTELRGITIDDPITVEGNPINFSTKNEQNAIQTVIDLSPIQDLHGYNKPWVGGAGKQLIDFSNPSRTTSQFTYTYVDGDLKIVATQNTSNYANMSFDGSNLKGKTFYVTQSWSASQDDAGYLQIQYKDANQQTQYVEIGKNISPTYSRSVPNDASNIELLIYLKNGISVNQGTWAQYSDIMVSETPSQSYEPYTNICSILPHEKIKIEGCGKNLLASQTIELNGTTYFRTTADTLLKAGTYTMSMYNDSNKTVKMIADKIVNGTTTTISTTDILTKTRGNIVFTLTEPAIIKISGRYSTAETITDLTVFKEFQIEVGNQATTFEPYKQSNSLTLPLPEDVYGGTLNLETGELVVDKVIADLGSLNWSESMATGHERFFANNLNNHKANSYKLVSDRFEAVDDYDILYNHVKDNVICMHPTTASNVEIHNSNYESLYDAAGFKTFITGSKIVYELSTPYTLHLTPSQLKLFKDVNNLNSSDYTTLTVTYHSNSMATLTPATDTTDGLLTAIDKRALDRTEEIVEGNPIQFETESVQVAKSTIVDLEPIQDLHGYDKPWVGGAGKNVLPSLTVSRIKELNTAGTWTNNVYEWRGITATLLTDSDNNITGIKTHGTASGRFRLFLCNTNDTDYSKFNNYILSGCPSGGNASTYYILIQKDSDPWTNNAQDVGSGATIVNIPDPSQIQFFIQISANIQVTNLIWYPMIRAASASATFAPYTNICPISGRTEVDILGCGKNLFDIGNSLNTWIATTGDGICISSYNVTTKVTATLNNNTGSITVTNYNSDGWWWMSKELKLHKNTDYKALNLSQYKIVGFDSLENGTYGTHISSSGGVFNSGNYKYWFVSIFPSNFSATNSGIYRLSETPTPFEPYIQSTSLQIQLGQTVYGGQLDVENGVLVVDTRYKEFTSTGSETWYKRPNKNIFYTAWTDTAARVPSSTGTEGCFNSNYKCVTKEIDLLDNGECVNSSSAISSSNLSVGARDERYTTVEDFKASLSTPMQIVYPLATPTTISLTPEQVKLLQGVNTITTNADNITLTYRNGSVATLNDLESLYAKLKAYIDSLHSS